MRSFEIRRRNVLLKHALAKARFAVVYIRMRSTSSFRSHVPWRAVPGLSRLFSGARRNSFACLWRWWNPTLY